MGIDVGSALLPIVCERGLRTGPVGSFLAAGGSYGPLSCCSWEFACAKSARGIGHERVFA